VTGRVKVRIILAWGSENEAIGLSKSAGTSRRGPSGRETGTRPRKGGGKQVTGLVAEGERGAPTRKFGHRTPNRGGNVAGS